MRGVSLGGGCSSRNDGERRGVSEQAQQATREQAKRVADLEELDARFKALRRRAANLRGELIDVTDAPEGLRLIDELDEVERAISKIEASFPSKRRHRESRSSVATAPS